MEDTHRALIVDDEEPGRINLRYALASHPGWQVVGEADSVAQARAVLAQQPVDVVFLDIQMPEESGLVLARSLSAQAEPPLVIFVTAHNAFAVDAFEVHALDYLLKPFNNQRLAQTLERAAQLLALRQRHSYGQALRGYLEGAVAPGEARFCTQISVRSVGQIECVRLADVCWIGAAGNYVELHTATRVILHRQPLSKLEACLDPRLFVRVHRAAIVRADQCVGLEVVGDGSYMLRLRCGDPVGVSERHVQALRASMGIT